jgi:hypothetical protein
MVRHIGLEVGVAGERSSPRGGQGGSSGSKSHGGGGVRTTANESQHEGEGVGVLGWPRFQRGRKRAMLRRGSALLTGTMRSRGRGPGGGRQPRSRRGSRERGGVSPQPTGDARPAAARGRRTLAWVAWPRHSGWQWRWNWFEKEFEIRLNLNDLKLFQTLTAPKMPFPSSKNLK